MSFLIPGLLGIGSSIIGANAQKNAANQQAAQQQALEQQAYQQQLQYVNAANQAARQAFLGASSQGNPYFQARQYMQPPQALGGGSFGGTQFGPGAAPPPSQGAPPAMGSPGGSPPQGAPSVPPAVQQAFIGGGQGGVPASFGSGPQGGGTMNPQAMGSLAQGMRGLL